MTTESTQTKAQRREAARAQAATLRAEQERKDKRARLITLGVLGAALVGLIAIIVFIVTRPTTAPTTDVVTPGSSTAAPSPAAANGGIPFGKEGVAGTTNAGAVAVDVYQDYICPACRHFEETNARSLDEMRKAGEITFVLHPVATLDDTSMGTNFSTRAAAATAYVAEHAPDRTLAFNEAMLSNQPAEGSAGLTNAEIAEIAESAGVPAAVADEIAQGAGMETFGGWVTKQTEADRKEALSKGTPTITLNGTRFEGNWTDPAALTSAVAQAAKK